MQEKSIWFREECLKGLKISPFHHEIMGKLASGRYHADGTSTNWCKIKNPAYTQMTARHELFERRTEFAQAPSDAARPLNQRLRPFALSLTECPNRHRKFSTNIRSTRRSRRRR